MSQSERLHYIDTTIREKGIVTVREAAEKFEVSTRTIKRDIEYLRCRLEAPVEFVPHKKGYRYSHPFDYFAYRSERVFLFYIFLLRLSESPTHFPFIEKSLIKTIKQTIQQQYLPLISRITYQIEEWEELNIELFSILFAALRDGRIVTVRYIDAQGKVSTRPIAPEHFIHYEGRWYVIAWDENKKMLRTFLLSRIKSAKVQSVKRTKRLSPDEIHKYIQSSYGIYKGAGGQTVCVRFYEPVSNIVKKQIWHKEQKVREGAHPEHGKYVEIQLPVHHPQELLGKVLRFGKYAEIVTPESVRKLWLDAMKEAYQRFC